MEAIGAANKVNILRKVQLILRILKIGMATCSNVQSINPIELSRVQASLSALQITFIFGPCQVNSENLQKYRKLKGWINHFFTPGALAWMSHAHCFAEASLCSGLVFSYQCKYKCYDSVLPPGTGRKMERMDEKTSSFILRSHARPLWVASASSLVNSGGSAINISQSVFILNSMPPCLHIIQTVVTVLFVSQ